ncbi:MAG: ABC transporter permease subunit [Candidatus Rokuibacteriota bacterium]
MRIWPIYKKELRLYFTSAVAYAVLTAFLFMMGWFFQRIFFSFIGLSLQAAANPMLARDMNPTDMIMRNLLSNMSVILLFLTPLLTMRIFAEERRSGTIELLLTYPVRDGAVLLGKYFAALTLYGVMIAITLVYPTILWRFGARLEWGPLVTGYLGLMLLGAAFLAIGVLSSSLTENQIVAGISTFAVLLALWVAGWFADYAGPTWGGVLRHLSVLEHNENFAKGVLDTKDLIYYVDLSVIALFLALRSVESRRWRA